MSCTSLLESWEAGVPAELIPLVKQQFDIVEGICATVPGSLFDSDKKPASHEKWDVISKEKNMEVRPLDFSTSCYLERVPAALKVCDDRCPATLSVPHIFHSGSAPEPNREATNRCGSSFLNKSFPSTVASWLRIGLRCLLKRNDALIGYRACDTRIITRCLALAASST